MIKDTSFGEGGVYSAGEASGSSSGCECTGFGCSCTVCDLDSTHDSIGQILLTPTQSVS